ncbi:MAG: hypothetical protein LBN38_05715 [Verrucomicrobiota bacterium]|jgi:Na+-transporting NADH:ubiquinone oxidoreductase subunit F|nr:hypothetical protein [Verrucomicrobiota bacterium]
MDIQRYRGNVVGKTALTHDIVHLRIEMERHSPFSYRAGQFIRLEAQVLPEPAAPVLRNYSLASAPVDPQHIELIIRKVPGGLCSTWIHDVLSIGDPIAFQGPMGLFHLSGSQRPIIGIAGGSGISALRSLFQEMLRTFLQRPTHFFFGARTRQDLYLLDEWAAFREKASWFTFIPVLSDEPQDSGWTGERGLVTDAVIRHLSRLAEHESYLCGSPGMIDAAIAVLTKHGVLPQHIFFDKFTV